MGITMERLLDALPVLIYLLGVAIEHTWPARPYPHVRWWRVSCIAFSLGGSVVAVSSRAGLDALIGDFHLVDGRSLGLWGIPIAVGGLTLAFYILHRSFLHKFDWSFRWIHQLHHSAERVDVWGANFGHPFQIVLQAIIVATIMKVTFGFEHAVIAWTTAILVFLNTFQHLNIRTPHWVGYFMQRPESHNIHHQRGVHAYNYSDLPLWDILFGTFNNPRDLDIVEVGYHDKASRQIGAMLIGRDVTVPP
jgi:sterol desaturase/sphingolipid hydroxylase (fatty acid hydroxylase superfamily)